MNSDRQNVAPCVIPKTPAPDPRCNDSAFALANPDICAANSALIIRPSVSLFCIFDSIRFRVFEYANGTETELTSGVTFESSDNSIFVVGVNSGSGTALAAGIATITATYAGKTVTATIKVNSGTGDACCDEFQVATAVAVDTSRSMTHEFGLGYTSRLVFAKAVATEYVSNLLSVAGSVKDVFKVWSFNVAPTEETNYFLVNTTNLASAIAGIVQTQQKTDLLKILTDITNDLIGSLDVQLADDLLDVITPNLRVIVIVTDGEHTIDSNRQAVLNAATTFKDAGGVIIVIGVRAAGTGFDLLERIATTGYFINATTENIDETFAQLNLIKSLTCAGRCVPGGDEFVNQPELEYSQFLNWQVIQGQVNLIGAGMMDFLPGNGLYVDMAAGSKALIRSIDSIPILSGRNYRIAFSAAGNQRQSILGQGLKVYIREATANDTDPNIFEQTVYPLWNDAFHSYGFVFPALFDANVRIFFEQLGTASNPDFGNLLDNVLFEDFSTLTTLLDDNFDDENLTFVEPACGPSAAVDPIDDPAEPTAVQFYFPSVDMWNGDEYSYAVSFLTLEGETDLSPVLSVNTSPYVASDGGVRLTFATPPANVIAVRIWRNIEDSGSDLWLLASLDPDSFTGYDDTEDHATFAARFDASIMPPTANSTGKSEGELGIGYAYCCYYTDTVVDNEDLVSAIPVMTSDTEPSGSVTTNSTDLAANGFYAFDDNNDTLYIGFEVVVGVDDPTYTTPVFLAYEFPAPITIRRYSLLLDDPNGPSPDGPNTWTFEGSNDGSSWTVLDTQTNVTGWDDTQTRVYDIGSPASYLHYRILVTVAQTSGITGPDGLGNYGAWHYIHTFKMFTSTTNIVTEFTNNCPQCADEPPGEQTQDEIQLPDIETPFTPPTIYTSTKSYCKSCAADQVMLTTPLAWTIQTHSSLAGALNDIVRLNDGAKKLRVFKVDLTGRAFNNPVTLSISGGDSAIGPFTPLNSIVAGYVGSVIMLLIDDSAATYEYYAFSFNRFVSDQASPVLSADSLYGSEVTQVCETATETSTVSPADAYDKALKAAREAAEAQVNCVKVYTANESAIAVCPLGSFGNSVTKSATRQSLVSQDDAINLAQAAAQSAAQDELVCTLSNNEERIIIHDATGTPSKADPYASVKYVSGLSGVITKVTVSLFGITHNSPDDIGIVLRSPTGTLVHLMGNVGGTPPGSTGTANVDLVLDDAAGSDLPDSSPLVSGTFRPKVYVGSISFPELPASPYGLLLSDFNGENPNGSWALFIIDDLTTFSGFIEGGWDITITSS